MGHNYLYKYTQFRIYSFIPFPLFWNIVPKHIIYTFQYN